MESKTVIEWLEQAKAEGYEWAERAIECMGGEKTRYYSPETFVPSLSEAIDCIDWAETSEGFVFWNTILVDLDRQGK